MNKTIENIIADVCNADKRNIRPDIKELAKLLSVQKTNDWYKNIVEKDN